MKLLFTPDEARVATCLGFMPEPVKRIHKKLLRLIEQSRTGDGSHDLDGLAGIDAVALDRRLETMLQKGLLNGGTDPDTGKSFYANAFLMMGMFDYQVNRMTGELMQAVDLYIGEAFLDEYKLSRVPQIRTIPVEHAVTKENPVATYEDIRHLINTRGPINVTECVCRKGKRMLGETCKKEAPKEACFQFGMVAHMYKRLGLGREISKEEARDIISKAEEAGLVLQPTNAQKPGTICCCCGCCCLILTHAKRLAHPQEVFATNHLAVIERGACTGCGTCIDRCPMDAVVLDGDGKATVDDERCLGCGACVPACPAGAIQLAKRVPARVPPVTQLDLFVDIGTGKARARDGGP